MIAAYVLTAVAFVAMLLAGALLQAAERRRRTVVEPQRLDVVDLGADDVVILQVDHDLSEDEAVYLRRCWHEAMESPQKVSVLSGGVSIVVLRRPLPIGYDPATWPY